VALTIAFDGGPTTQGAGVGRYASGLLGALLAQDTADQHTVVLPRGARLPAATSAATADWRPVHLPVGERVAEIVWHRLRLPIPVDRLCGMPDVYHSPNFLLPPLARARGVVTVHDLSYLRLPQYAFPALAEYLRKTVPRSLERAELVLADSRNTAADVVELLHVPPDRVRTVYPGVGPAFGPAEMDGELTALAGSYGLRRPYVLCVGTIEPRKNLVAAIQAFMAVAPRLGSGLQLVLAGAIGWLAEETMGAAQEAGDRVRLVGRVAEEDLPALYRQAEALLYPSHYEGFGLPPLEAMACGTPVIVARNSSLPEVTGDVAVYCGTDAESIAAALDGLFTDPSAQERLRRDGPARARLFTWEKAAETVRSLYHELA